ncbi:MAG: haloacid dehalogenase-like hydrolase [Lachnospiraceae bacterium]|nr:haloacid dehalogenase-like hydrolase [Lachnospiraceae bacterium]
MSNNTKLIKNILIAAAFLVCVAALAIMSRERAAGSAANATESITADSSTAESNAAESTSAESSVTEEDQSENNGQALTAYWSADSAAAQSLRDYVTKVTDEANADSFIPVKDRIAVFDMDGTLTCETFYTYYDTMMFIEYCLYDHPDQVSEELKQAAEEIKPGYKADETLARNFAKAYAGMTVDEFYEYAVEFGKKYTDSFNNMRYIDGFYLPMVELVEYLYENDFTIYVISGTERTTTRAIVANSPIKDYVTPNHVIGTDFEVKQPGYEDIASNMDFKYADGDDLVLTGGFIQKNLNANKSIYVEREIGQRPVLAFGNSGSDTSMMNYAIDSRNQYPAEAYMIVADDSVREWGTADWAEKSAEYTEMGYVPISMEKDFAKIYPDTITKAAEQYVEREQVSEPVEEVVEAESEEEELANAA